ncbi:hypothetical protein MJK72_03650 [Klebsiella pneumoniae]|nr:hypothetical protein MJK72_03650 [Klebsiella pneumoniae]
MDYRQTFFSLNTNTEEIFHFARRIKLSTHFIRFTYIPDIVFGPFFAAPDGNIPLKIIGKWMPFGVSFSPGLPEGAIQARARLSAAEW